WRGSGPRVRRDRIIGNLAQGHTVAAPAALEGTRVHVEYQKALRGDHINLASIFVEVKAPLRSDDVGLLVVFLERRFFRRPVAKVPEKFPVAREFEDAVLRCSSTDPDVTFPVCDDGLQSGWPLRNIAGASPRTDHIAFRVQLNHLRTSDAAVNSRRVITDADFIVRRRRSTIQKPYVIVLCFHI